MNLSNAERKDIGACFGVPNAPYLDAIPVKSASFSVTRLLRPLGDGEVVDIRIPQSDAYLLILYQQDTQHADILARGKKAPSRCYRKGTICLIDLRFNAAITLEKSLDAIAIVLPCTLLDEIAELSSLTKSRELRCRRGEPDSVISNLGLALSAMLVSPSQSPPALLKHLAVAVCAHLLQDYRDHALRNGTQENGLSVKQQKAAKDWLLDHLATTPPLSELADVVGLSPGHFAVQFKRSTGMTPHQWLTGQRIERAKDLLCQDDVSLKDIANQCGFTDQSHLTKVFSRFTGNTPFAWRQMELFKKDTFEK